MKNSYKPFKTLLLSFASIIFVAAVMLSCKDDDNFWDAFIPETDEEPTSTQVEGYVFYPAVQQATDANIAQLKVPAGFSINKFADGMGKPRILVVNSNGQVYTSDRDAGIVMMLTDADKDGIAENKKTVATIKQVHGLSIHNGKMYMVAVNEVLEPQESKRIFYSISSMANYIREKKAEKTV